MIEWCPVKKSWDCKASVHNTEAVSYTCNSLGKSQLRSSSHLTHWGQDNMLAILQMTFSKQMFWKLPYFDTNLLKFNPKWVNNNKQVLVHWCLTATISLVDALTLDWIYLPDPHFNCNIAWASKSLESPEIRLLVKQLIQTNPKDKIKAH